MAAAAPATMTPEPIPAAEPVHFCEGVADPGLQAGYVADGGGIVSVGLREGRRLWRSDRAAFPPIADGERLAAAGPSRGRPNAIEVVVLDAAGAGEPVLVSEPVALPDWVAVAPGRRDAFRLTARRSGRRLLLRWEARARYEGGAHPPAAIRRAAARRAAGGAEVDLESGAVAPSAGADEGEGESRVRCPPLDAGDLPGPWHAGATVARLVWDVAGTGQALGLEIAPAAGGERAVVELASGHGLVAEVTPDGVHVLVHQEPPPAGRPPWTVFAVETGRRVATLTHDDGARAPAILGGRAYYVVEDPNVRTLRARELASDALTWELTLGERPASAAPPLRQ